MKTKAIAACVLAVLLFLALTPHPNTPPCVPKPYPVTMNIQDLPPELQTVFQKFVDDMNYQIIDEIYLRFCNYIADDVYCLVYADTLIACAVDSLLMNYHAIIVKDYSDTGNAAGILLYEDTTTSQYDSNTVPQQFFVSLQVSSDDTNNVRENVRLKLPGRYAKATDGGNLGTSLHDTTTAGANMAPNYPFSARLSNSYLVGDGRGHLMWQDRDDYTRVQLDTLIADTSAGTGVLNVETEILTLKADSQRAISGLWSGNLGPRFHHFANTASRYVGFWPKATLKQIWNWTWPDTQSVYEGGYLRHVDGGTAAPKWAPVDDEFIIRGLDTIPSTETSTTVNPLKDGFRPTGRNFHNRYETLRSYMVYLQWVRFDDDSAIGTSASDGTYGSPDPTDPRYHELRVSKTFDMDFIALGDPRLATDSTFIIITPAFTGDTTKVVEWMCVGRIAGWDGEG